MLKKLLNSETIQIMEKVKDWKEAIRIVSQPLLNSEVIKPEYIEAIFKTHEEMGPYYVLAPGIAMPHARPEQGSNDIGLSLLIIRDGVEFGSEDGDPVYIIIMLSAKDSDSHINVISSLSEFLDNDDEVEAVKSSSVEDIVKIINKY